MTIEQFASFKKTDVAKWTRWFKGVGIQISP